MKFVTRPPTHANGTGHGGHDPDEALFAFFRSELPHPWPQLKLPDGAPPAPPPVRLAQPTPGSSLRSWFRSPRFALAASVALLIAGSAVLSSALTAPSMLDAPSLDKGDLKDLNREIKKGLPPVDDDDGVDVKIESLDQIGNGPGTIRIKAELFEKK
jgi:hypothetical protein